MKLSPYIKFFGIAVVVILLDQLSKMAVYFNMEMGALGEIKLLGNWLKFHYTLNPGMAFGITFGSIYGKLFLTSFRICAMVAIGYYLYKLIKDNSPLGLIISISLILGGAIGNLIDSVFYGKWLNNAPAEAPSPWFHGQVIDMVYVDLWEGVLPGWFPLIGGEYYAFWPIFNLADSSIFLGVFTILLFQKSFFEEETTELNSSND